MLVAVVGVLRLGWLLEWSSDHPRSSGPTSSILLPIPDRLLDTTPTRRRRGGPTAGRTPTGRVPHTAHHREHVTFEQGTNLGSLAPQSELN